MKILIRTTRVLTSNAIWYHTWP